MLMRLIPVFKGADFFPHDLRLPFMRYKGIAIGASLVAMAISLALCMTLGLNYGVDFKGGSLVELQAKSGNADVGALRDKLNRLGVGNVQIQQFGGPANVLVRLEEQPGGEKPQQAALKKVSDATEADFTQRRVEVVGPGRIERTAHDRLYRGCRRHSGDRRLCVVSLRVAVCRRRGRGADA